MHTSAAWFCLSKGSAGLQAKHHTKHESWKCQVQSLQWKRCLCTDHRAGMRKIKQITLDLVLPFGTTENQRQSFLLSLGAFSQSHFNVFYLKLPTVGVQEDCHDDAFTTPTKPAQRGCCRWSWERAAGAERETDCSRLISWSFKPVLRCPHWYSAIIHRRAADSGVFEGFEMAPVVIELRLVSCVFSLFCFVLF